MLAVLRSMSHQIQSTSTNMYYAFVVLDQQYRNRWFPGILLVILQTAEPAAHAPIRVAHFKKRHALDAYSDTCSLLSLPEFLLQLTKNQLLVANTRDESTKGRLRNHVCPAELNIGIL